MPDLAEVEPDGRRARRERGRTAVTEALFDLLTEHGVPPTTEVLAARAGVSASSIFRYFSGIDDLHQQTIERYFVRFAPLFEIPAIGHGTRPARIRRYIDARLELYATIAPIARLARTRAFDHPLLSATLHDTRERFAHQVQEHFAPEVQHRSRARSGDLVALVASLTSFEAWDLLTDAHHADHADLRRAWTTGLTALLDPS